jgi:uncharacterized protein (TIGR02145 family)
MRYLLSVLMLTASVPLLSQDDCDLFNIQELSAANLSLQAEIDALSCYAGVEMDGYRYKGVPIGEQCWFAENLRTTMYADGSAIPEVTGYSAWSGLSSGARCYYDNDPVTSYGYGRMYNWHAVDDTRGLCPTGWHVPTDDEWTALETYLGANGHSGTEGTALKSTSGWNSGGNGTDDFGFSALPGGLRYANNGNFNVAGNSGYWWSSSPSGGDAWRRALSSNYPDFNQNNGNPRFGFSVRCLRDAE